jgi:hypothetical protein
MAKAICGEHGSPALYEQALIIAECQIVLLNLRAAQVALLERHRVGGRKPERRNQRSDFSANEELALAIEALDGGDVRPAIGLLKRQTRTLRVASDRVVEAKRKVDVKESDRTNREGSSPPSASCPDSFPRRSEEDQPAIQVLDEVDAFRHSLLELVSLERYERRALSRRKRAIRMFEAVTIVAPFLNDETKGR